MSQRWADSNPKASAGSFTEVRVDQPADPVPAEQARGHLAGQRRTVAAGPRPHRGVIDPRGRVRTRSGLFAVEAGVGHDLPQPIVLEAPERLTGIDLGPLEERTL